MTRNETKLHNYLQMLVSEKAEYKGGYYELRTQDLTEDELSQLAELYLETTDREVTECVYGDDFTLNSDYTVSLLRVLRDPSDENKLHFAEVTRKNTIKYFDNTFNRLLEEACEYFASALDDEEQIMLSADRRASVIDYYYDAMCHN